MTYKASTAGSRYVGVRLDATDFAALIEKRTGMESMSDMVRKAIRHYLTSTLNNFKTKSSNK